MCLKIYLTESYCIISPGDNKLVNQSYRVVVVLNCSLHGEGFDGEGFQTVHWTMNGQPVAEGHITTDPLRKKKWSAVFLTNVTTDKDLSEFKCVMSSGEEYMSCYASPGKFFYSFIHLAIRFSQHFSVRHSLSPSDCRFFFAVFIAHRSMYPYRMHGFLHPSMQ